MSTGSTLPKRQIIISVCFGLLVYHLISGGRGGALPGSFVAWTVPLLLIAGGYVVFKERGNDIRHYEAMAAETGAGSRDLKKRGRYLLVVAGVFTATGSIILVRLLLHTLG